MKKNLLAAGLAVALSIGGFGISNAYAKGATLNPTINKTVEVNKGEFTPSMHFKFNAVPGEPQSASAGKPQVYAGPKDGVTIDTISIEESSEVATENISKTAAITTDISKFTKPGIFVYEVSEEQVKAAIDGMQYDTTTYNLYVQVVNGDSGYEVAGYWFATSDNPLEKKECNFTNKYADGPEYGQLHNLVVTKKLSGNMADPNKDFQFTVSVDTADANDVFTVVSADNTKAKLHLGESMRLSLKGGEQFKVLGCSQTDQIRVVEDDYTADGYTTQNKETSSLMEQDVNIEVINTKNQDTPTGLFLHYTPYIAMVAAAGILFVISSRKQSQE